MEPLPQTAETLRELARQGEASLAIQLHVMADRIRDLVPDLVGLSLAVIEEGLTLTLVSSAEQFGALDAVQYVDGGPCIADVDRTEPMDVNVADLLDEDRWELYARASAAVGVASSLSLPVMDGDSVIGGVNLYASTADAFKGLHEEIAAAVGSDAKLAVTNADLSFRTRQLAAEAPVRVREAADVNVALGMISVRQGVTIPVARELLRAAAVRAVITEAQAARVISNIRTG